MNKDSTLRSFLIVSTALSLVLISVVVTYLVLQSKHEQDITSITESQPIFEQDLAQVGQNDLQNHAENLNIDANTELSEEEKFDLVYMREEEKLARDVYLTAYDKWGLQIFQNISRSEQKHTDSIKTLLDAYGIEDTVDDQVGAFRNQDLQTLYDQLAQQVSVSEVDAIQVGALIEDLDIVDLQKAMSRTTDQAILTVYGNLQRGSRNHLRAFTQTLSRYGEDYTPSYLSEEAYLDIISSGTEKGSSASGGNGYQGGR